MANKNARRIRKLTYSLQYSMEDLIIDEQAGYDRIRLKDGNLTRKIGWPILTVAIKRFVLPKGATDISISTQDEQWTRLKGKFNLGPAQPPRSAMAKRPGDPEKSFFELVSSGKVQLPPNYPIRQEFVPMLPEVTRMQLVAFPVVEMGPLSHLGGRAVLAVRIHPLRYRPRIGIVEILSHATLTIEYKLGRSHDAISAHSPAITNMDLKKLMSMVVNPEDIKLEFLGMSGSDKIPSVCFKTPSAGITKKFGPSRRFPVDDGGLLFTPITPLLPCSNEEWPYVIITDDYEWNEIVDLNHPEHGDVAAPFLFLLKLDSINRMSACMHDLDIGTIPDELKEEFSNHGIVISGDDSVVVTERNKWDLTSAGKHYLIRNDVRALNVYSAPEGPGLIAEFERLARWKTMKGQRARVVSISEIMSGVFGPCWGPGITRDLPEAIRNFLKFAHQSWHTRYCLLGGDYNIIPARHILGNSTIEKNNASQNSKPVPGKMLIIQDPGFRQPPVLRYQSCFDLTRQDVFFARDHETSLVIHHKSLSNDPAVPYWVWTIDDNYDVESPRSTRYIVVHGPNLAALDYILPEYGNMIPTDLYYSLIESAVNTTAYRHDWDPDSNGFYGWWRDGQLPEDVDWGSDISIGRAPAADPQTARIFVDKVLTYELFFDVHDQDYKSLPSDYVRRLTCLGSEWGSHEERFSWDIDSATSRKEDVITEFNSILSGLIIQRAYRDIYGMPHTESNLRFLPCPAGDLSNQDQVEKLRALANAGPHFLSVSDHGIWWGTAGFSVIHPEWVNPAKTTNWPCLFIGYFDSCLTNDFDRSYWTEYRRSGEDYYATLGDRREICLGKRMIQHGGGGAVGYVGNSRDSSTDRELEFWASLASDQQPTLGGMYNAARDAAVAGNDPWMAFISTLLGDPELPIYTNPPTPLTVSYPPFVYGKEESLTVSVYSHGVPQLMDLNICVCQMSKNDPLDKVYYQPVPKQTKGAVEDGHYTFDIRNAGEGDIYITVTGRNYIPYTGKVIKVGYPVSCWKVHTRGTINALARRDDGSIYAGSSDGYLYAIDSSGQLIWKHSCRGSVSALDTADDGMVLAGISGHRGISMLLLDKSNNVLRHGSDHGWNHFLAGKVLCAQLDRSLGMAYAGLQNQGMRAHTWGTNSHMFSWNRSDLGSCHFLGRDDAGNIYAAVIDGRPVTGQDSNGRDITADGNPKIVKLSPGTGTSVWRDADIRLERYYEIGLYVDHEPRAFLVEPDGISYVSTRNHELHKIDQDGRKLWEISLDTAVHSLFRREPHLYAGGGNGKLYSIDPGDGSVIWAVDVGDRADCLQVGADGEIYVGSWPGISFISKNGKRGWFRESTGGVHSLLYLDTSVYAGCSDGWIYQVEAGCLDEVLQGDDWEIGRDRVGAQPVDKRHFGEIRSITPVELMNILG